VIGVNPIGVPDLRDSLVELTRWMRVIWVRTRRLGLSVGLLAILAEIATGLWNRPEPIGLDFHTYVAASQVGLHHGWSHIYEQPLVILAQANLVPGLAAQPFLSPPPVAWLASLFAALPYNWSFVVWSLAMLLALGCAAAWSNGSRGLGSLLAAGLVITPWWVLIADRVGQVVPLVAVGILVAWRLVRDDRAVAAGLVLGLVLLKPNTAFLVPVALLASGRTRTFTSWLISAGIGSILLVGTVGISGLESYVNQLEHPPPGTDALSLEVAFGVGGLVSVGLRLAIIAAVVAGAMGLRSSPGLAIALGTVGSLLVTPYLHLSDLTLLAAAGVIVWRERPTVGWRAGLGASWLLVNPLFATRVTPTQNRWPLFELAWIVVLVVHSWRKTHQDLPDAQSRTLLGPLRSADLGFLFTEAEPEQPPFPRRINPPAA
jgi:hypothetical protein